MSEDLICQISRLFSELLSTMTKMVEFQDLKMEISNFRTFLHTREPSSKTDKTVRPEEKCQ